MRFEDFLKQYKERKGFDSETAWEQSENIWTLRKQAATTAGEAEFRQEYMARPIPPDPASVEVLQLKAQLAEAKRELVLSKSSEAHWRAAAQIAQKEVSYLRGRQASTSLPTWLKAHLKFLIFACHPDRNAGKAEAEAVTKELLKLRGVE